MIMQYFYDPMHTPYPSLALDHSWETPALRICKVTTFDLKLTSNVACVIIKSPFDQYLMSNSFLPYKVLYYINLTYLLRSTQVADQPEPTSWWSKPDYWSGTHEPIHTKLGVCGLLHVLCAS